MEAQTRSRNPPIRPLDPFTPFPVEHTAQSISARFERQVREHADRVAIQTPDEHLSYADVNGIANDLAHAILARRGHGPEPIALLFDHGAAVVPAMFGVLKSGKFYVALDASYPRERLRYLLADSGARLIIADHANVALAGRLSNDAIDVIDFDSHAASRVPANVEVTTSPDEVASILYTSGSTGGPKGVMNTHRTMLADIRNVTNAWGVSPRDRWLLHTSMGFGGSTRTIFGALLNGSGLYAFDSKRYGFAPLPDWLRRHAITIFRTGTNSVPKLHHHTVRSPDISERPHRVDGR